MTISNPMRQLYYGVDSPRTIAMFPYRRGGVAMSQGSTKWYWTDDLARLLESTGRAEAVMQRWITEPVAVRGEGEAIAVAEALLADESDESHLAA